MNRKKLSQNFKMKQNSKRICVKTTDVVNPILCAPTCAPHSHQLYYHLASFHFEYNESHSLDVHVCLLSTLPHLCDTTQHTFAICCALFNANGATLFFSLFFGNEFRILRLYSSGPRTVMMFRMFLHLDE